MLRNHAEGVIGSYNKKINKSKLINMIGGNYRMGEIEAAIGIEQLKILKEKFKTRNIAAKKLSHSLKKLYGIKTLKSEKLYSFFYIYPIKLDLKLLKISRIKFIELL